MHIYTKNLCYRIYCTRQKLQKCLSEHSPPKYQKSECKICVKCIHVYKKKYIFVRLKIIKVEKDNNAISNEVKQPSKETTNSKILKQDDGSYINVDTGEINGPEGLEPTRYGISILYKKYIYHNYIAYVNTQVWRF